MDRLKDIHDPHIPVNIVDLGFIRDVEVKGKRVRIKMTLTNPMCPMSSVIKREVIESIEGIEDVDEVDVELVFDPPWSPDMISEEARKKLGLDG